MKKSIIAGAGVMALAAAAMPFAGVFADQYSTVTDTVKLSVTKSCKMEAASNTANVTLTASADGVYGPTDGTVMTLSCNSNLGWTLKATASSLTNQSDNTKTVPFGAYSASATVWSAKIGVADGTGTGDTGASVATIADKWGDFTATAASSTTILSVAENSAAVQNIKVTPQYKAHLKTDMPSGEYQGTMEFTFAENPSGS